LELLSSVLLKEFLVSEDPWVFDIIRLQIQHAIIDLGSWIETINSRSLMGFSIVLIFLLLFYKLIFGLSMDPLHPFGDELLKSAIEHFHMFRQ
jgi:hypothetical protein